MGVISEDKLLEARKRRLEIEANPTFDDLKALWPSNMRGNLAVALKKWEQITGPGLKTRVYDKDANAYEEIFLRDTPQAIYAGAEVYLKGFTGPDYKLSQYAKRLQNFLNGGYWQQ